MGSGWKRAGTWMAGFAAAALLAACGGGGGSSSSSYGGGGGGGGSGSSCSPPTSPGSPYNLQFCGSGFTVHIGTTMHVRLLDTAALLANVATTTFSITADTFSITFTGRLTAGKSYYLDYYQDQSNTGTCNTSPDHYWHNTSLVSITGNSFVSVTHTIPTPSDVPACNSPPY